MRRLISHQLFGVAIYNTFNVQQHLLGRRALRVFHARSDSVWNEKAVA
jgi:hypothetical protein